MLTASNSKVNQNNVEQQKILMKKDLEPDIYTILHHFINPKYENNIQNTRLTSMYTSSLIHENYLNVIRDDTSLEDLCSICDYNSIGNIYKKYLFKDQNWELSEYMGILGTYIPGIIIKRNYKPLKNNNKLKINGNFSEVVVERGFIMKHEDIYFSLSNILFPLNPNSRWLKNMTESSRIFYEFMKENYVLDVNKAIKYLDNSYYCQILENKDYIKLVKKVKTKFKSEWRLLEK